MPWRHRAALCLLLACVLLVIARLGPGPTGGANHAPGEINLAGIVIDYGDGRVSFAVVPFTETSLSGMDVLDRSGAPLLTIEFGALGIAVCAIEDVGCDLGGCRARLCQTGDPDSPFWQYVQHADAGMWQAAPLGASSSSVGDGDVEGWFWAGDLPDDQPFSLEAIADRLDVDLDTLRSNSASPLTPTFRTFGGATDNRSGVALRELVGGGLALGLVAALGVAAVIRSRRMSRR